MVQCVTSYRGWVALKGRVNLAQTEQLALLQVTCLHPHGVQGWSSVTLWEKHMQIYITLVENERQFQNTKVRETRILCTI